jgi:hypothetical protein
MPTLGASDGFDAFSFDMPPSVADLTLTRNPTPARSLLPLMPDP